MYFIPLISHSFEYPLGLFGGKTAIQQKTGLSCLLPEIRRRIPAELLLPNCLDALVPVHFHCGQYLGCKLISNTALKQFPGDPYRSIAFSYTAADICLGIALIILYPRRFKIRQDFPDSFRTESSRQQFLL
jgi:hypothetical protein